MKIHGKKISANIEVVVIPRQDGDIVFQAQAVLDYSDFEKLNPRPVPPEIMRPGGVKALDVEDKVFNEKIFEWAQQKTSWMVLKSLQATPGLEWETVNLSDPSTWANYAKEMTESGLTPAEIARVVDCVTTACGLNQKKIDEATQRFLAGRPQAK
jgi:hypothetical protein